MDKKIHEKPSSVADRHAMMPKHTESVMADIKKKGRRKFYEKLKDKEGFLAKNPEWKDDVLNE